MDFPIVILFLFVIGSLKLVRPNNISQEGTEVRIEEIKEVPIGNNLMNEREPEAFCFYLKEFGL